MILFLFAISQLMQKKQAGPLKIFYYHVRHFVFHLLLNEVFDVYVDQ